MSSSDKGKTRRNRLPRKCTRPQTDDAADRPLQPFDRAYDAKELEELSQMEAELGAMQHELEEVQKEREVLENQRRVLKQVAAPASKADPSCAPARGAGPGPLVLREGWLQRLQEDLDAKVLENCELRTQVERLRQGLEATQIGQETWETHAMELEHKLRALENHKNKMVGSKEAAAEQQQVLALLRQKYRDGQEELEEMRALIEDQAGHLECYRNKYLQAQQQVEEQRRQMEHLELTQERLADQVQMEMHRVKAEFQEKLQELLPLPDILKSTQTKLHEEKQQRAVAERNCAELSHKLNTALEKNAECEKEITSLRAQQQAWTDERQSLLSQIESLERKSNKLKEDIKWLKQGVAQMEEVEAHNEKLYEGTLLELAHTKGELEAARQASARQAGRLRDTTDTMRRSFHSQIAELERELAQTRAKAAAAHKEKEELQLRLQTQLANITQSFGQAQERIKSLQSVVDVLKSNVLHIDSLPEAALQT